MRRSFAVIGGTAALVAGLTAGLPAHAATGGASAEHRRIVEFWTAENRASAVPRDVDRHGPGPDERAKPSPGGGGGTGSTVTGASWTGGGQVAKTTGKLFFTEHGVRYTCSGSAVANRLVNVVLTAGHCVHGGGAGETFVTNWIFYPAYGTNPSSPPYGGWTATDLFTTSLWATDPNGDGFDDDAGFAVVTDGADGTLAGVLGALPTITFAAQTPATVQTSFGYPASKKYSSGNVLTYCQGPTKLTYDSADTYGLACDMTGGSSGGPWFTGFDGPTGAGTITSLNSYGYASLRNVMFGPIFGSGEQSAYNSAGTGDCTTPSSTCVSYS